MLVQLSQRCWLWMSSFSEAGSYDRVVIQELLKEIAQTQQVDVGAKQRFKGVPYLLLHPIPI